MSDLEQAFHQEMVRTYQEAVKIGYRPARFMQMLSDNSGIETARIILAQPNITDGFTTLFEKKRLDLAVEALVLKPEYAALFSDDERAHARTRLAEVGYTAPWDRDQSRADRFTWQDGDVTITLPTGEVLSSPPASAIGAPTSSAASSSMVDRLAHAVSKTQGSGARLYDPAKLEPLNAIFRQRFTSLTSDDYQNSERGYKLMAAERMRELIGQDLLRQYIDQGQFEQAKQAIVRSCQGSFKINNTRQPNNLLNQWDMRALLDAPAEPLARALYDLLYGEASFVKRFEAWVNVLTHTKPGVWPAATYFLMLHDPSKYIFIKPTLFQSFFKAVGIDEPWPTRPDVTAYRRYRQLAKQLLTDLAPLGAQDLIDVQSWIWSVYYYANRSAWIFQSNPQNYNLPGALAELEEIDWGVRQHANDIRIGDTVYLWEAGDNAGLLATATVLTEAATLPEDERERRFYRDPARFNGAERRVKLHIEQVLPTRLSRSALAADPALTGMAILKNAQGTNFKLTPAEDARIKALLQASEAAGSLDQTAKPGAEIELSDDAGAQTQMTGAEAGLNGEDQVRIALQAMVDRGGQATVPQIYAAVEAHMEGAILSQQGKDSLRTFINRNAVNKGYVHPYDGKNPVWRITDAGRAWLTDDIDPPEFTPFDGSTPSRSIEEWQARLKTTNEFLRFVAHDYPAWLRSTFGDQFTVSAYHDRELTITLNGTLALTCWFNLYRGIYIWVPEPSSAQLALLQAHFAANNLKPREAFNRPGYRFMLYDQADYDVLKELTLKLAADATPEWPPEPLDGPAFVLVHGDDWGEQRYGESYTFSNKAGGAPMRLLGALQANASSSTPTPTYVIIYRPGPHYAFTAWARVAGFAELPASPSEVGDSRTWKLTLDQHEFPVPISARSLIDRLSWLGKGLAVAFRGISIRQITSQEFAMILDEARSTGARTPSDAAYAVLSQAGGGPLSLKDIYERARGRGLLGAQVSQLDLSNALQRAVERFSDLGGNMWVLAAPPPSQAVFEPRVIAGMDASFWRIHFPRELWDEARRTGVIGIDWPVDSTNQSVQRFKRIKIGDRVVVYLRGAVIGSIGVVTRAAYDTRLEAGAADGLFGGQYAQRIEVAWADLPAEPMSLFDALQAAEHINLYNRLKNPHTVIPLSRANYIDILTLMRIDDVGTPAEADDDTSVEWPRLTSYRDFAQVLERRVYTAAELLALAHDYGDSLGDVLDQEELVDRLRELRVLHSDGQGNYQLREYVGGDPAALIRLMALALLLPVEGTADRSLLPAVAIVPRLRAATEARSFEAFAPELGPNGGQLLRWYAEAGLVELGDGSWQIASGALDTLPGDDPNVQAYNQFLDILLQGDAKTLVTDLPDAGNESLKPVAEIEARLRELARELMIDPTVVRRIYRSLLAGRHVVLSGPPGTGKTELAKLLPPLLWREEPQTFYALTSDLDKPPVEVRIEQRHGYAPIVVTATEDWGVRDVVGGIGPRLDEQRGSLSFTIEHGLLTRVVLQHYEGTDSGRRIPAQPHAPTRRDYRADDKKRYRGAWLVIDEFTRAPVDAAFGSLLTTLSGGSQARLAVPVSSGESREIPLPRDFRIIGTLNSFDRHFLNQISEAMKRRFDFIDVLPPHPRYADFEQGIAVKQALERIAANNLAAIAQAGSPATYRWDTIVAAVPANDPDGIERYIWHTDDQNVRAALQSFWRIFSGIRIFRQLGTAQAIAVYTNLFAGHVVNMEWDAALDTALADSLADQLQVLTRDEQQVIEAFILHSGSNAGANFLAEFRNILKRLPPARQRSLAHALHEADQLRNGTTAIPDETTVAEEVIVRLFQPGESLALPRFGSFRQRLRDLIGERGL